METNFHTVKNSFRISAEVCLAYEIRSKHFNSSKETIKLIMIMGAFGTMKHLEEQSAYIVNYFIEKAQSIEVLTYDHRGIGQSISTSNERQTSSILANDASSLINHVWNDDSVVDVYGASMGGMVAQELSSLLRQSCRIRSLYLSVTSRGDIGQFSSRIMNQNQKSNWASNPEMKNREKYSCSSNKFIGHEKRYKQPTNL